MPANEKHLEFIQTAITRAANNSFSYKGWSVAVSAALVAFFLDKRHDLIVGGIYPILIFWYLDAYSLAIERSYRSLYNAAREGKVSDFDMDASQYRLPLFSDIKAMLASSLVTFYGLSIASVLILWKVSR